jgi:hypothetical protein
MISPRGARHLRHPQENNKTQNKPIRLDCPSNTMLACMTGTSASCHGPMQRRLVDASMAHPPLHTCPYQGGFPSTGDRVSVPDFQALESRSYMFPGLFLFLVTPMPDDAPREEGSSRLLLARADIWLKPPLPTTRVPATFPIWGV